jgi:hypothetical protein
MAHFWLALALFILLPAIGAVFLFRRGLALWRDLKRGGAALADGLDDLGGRLERMSQRVAGVGDATARVEPSVARLQTSLAELGVLRAAVRDVQDAVGRMTAVYPRK